MVLYSTLQICAKIRKTSKSLFTNEVSILHFFGNFIRIDIQKKTVQNFWIVPSMIIWHGCKMQLPDP